MYKHLFVLFCVICVIGAQYEIDSPCKIPNHGPGVCRSFKNCTFALRMVSRDHKLTGIEVCIYEDDDIRSPIVCCPDNDPYQVTGRLHVMFDWKIDYITNDDLKCWYKGDVPMICCPKYQSYVLPPEPEGCPPLTIINPPITINRFEKIAWQKCLETRQLTRMCEWNNITNVYFRKYSCNVLDNHYKVSPNGQVDAYAEPKEFSHMAVLGCNSENDVDTDITWIGGGSLISELFILTAAHVLEPNALFPIQYALLGALNKTDIRSGSLHFIIRRIPHPRYISNKEHDIGLLELNTRVQFSEFIYPICLPVPDIEYNETNRIIAGWGQRNDSPTSGSNVLLKGYVDEVDSSNCTFLSDTWDNETMICAIGKKPPTGQYSDTCEGDSGGPLMAKITNRGLGCQYVVAGVVSRGPNCGKGDPGVYTRVAPYVEWIVQRVWSDELREKKKKNRFV